MQHAKKTYKKFFATSATAALVASVMIPVASAEAAFLDVNPKDAHAANINALVEAGIIKGYPDGTFKPNASLTRGHVVKMLGKWLEAQGIHIPEDFNQVQRFRDVPVNAADQELVRYAALVKDAGVFVGSNGNLNPFGNITRENMALTLDRAYKAVFGKSLIEIAESFENTPVKDLAVAKEEARAQIQALRNIGISNVDLFRPKDTVTRAQFASFLNRTIQLNPKPNEEEAPVQALAIQSFKATGISKLTVTFNRVVTSADTANFKVTRNNTNIHINNIKWNENQTEAVLTLDHKLADGTYQLTVNGVSEQPLTATVTTNRETVSAIEFLSDRLVFTGRSETKEDGKRYREAIITYAIYNQYGEDITKQVPDSLKADIKRIDIFGSDDDIEVKDGRFIVWVDNDEDDDAVGTVALTYENNDVEVTAIQEIQLSDESEPAQVEVVGIYSPAGKELTVENLEDQEEFSILFKLKDQYGVEIDPEFANRTKNKITTGDTTILDEVRKGLRVSVSDDDIFEVEDEEGTGVGFGKDGIQVVNVDGEYYFAIDIFAENPKQVKGGENTVTFKARAIGEEVSKTFKVADDDQPHRIEIGLPDDVVAGGEEVKLPIFAYNKAGEVITSAKVLNEDLRKGKIKISPDSGLKKNDSMFLFVEEKGNVYLKFETANNLTDKVKDYDIEIEVEQSGIEQEVTIDVHPNAYPVTIASLKDKNFGYVFVGEQKAIEPKNFLIEDQYGRVFDNKSSGSAGNHTFYDIKVKSFSDAFEVTGNKVKSLKKGSGTIEVTLMSYDLKGKKQEHKYNVAFRSFDIDDFDSFKVKSDSLVYGGEEYVDDAGVKVVGVKGNIEVDLPKDSKFYSITSVGKYLNTDGLVVTPDAVAIKNDGILDKEEDRYESDITVTMNKTGDVLHHKITIAREKAKANSIAANRNDKLVKGALQDFNITLTNGISADGKLTVDEIFDKILAVGSIEINDQYGNGNSAMTIDYDTGHVTFPDRTTEYIRIVVSDIDSTLGSGIVSANGTPELSIVVGENGLQAGDSFTIKLTIDGKTKELKVYLVEEPSI
jgi:S-layer homology domain